MKQKKLSASVCLLSEISIKFLMDDGRKKEYFVGVEFELLKMALLKIRFRMLT